MEVLFLFQRSIILRGFQGGVSTQRAKAGRREGLRSLSNGLDVRLLSYLSYKIIIF